MNGCRRVFTCLAGLAGLATIAAPAAASLPDLHITLGEAFPVTATAKAPAATVGFSTAGGAVMTGTGAEVTLTWKELSSLGTYLLAIKNYVKGAKKCKTAGDAAGTLLISGEAHLVFVELSPGLKIAALLLVPKTKIECEGINVTIEGLLLGTYTGALNSELTEFKGGIKGEKGKQELTKYENEKGETVESLFLSEAGTGFTKTALNISEELAYKANKMIEILG
jgi:hypothetical protein